MDFCSASPSNPVNNFSVDTKLNPLPFTDFLKFFGNPSPFLIQMVYEWPHSLYNHIDANFKRRFLKCLFPFKLNRLFREMSSIGYRVLIELFEIVSDSPFLLWLCRILNSPLFSQLQLKTLQREGHYPISSPFIL